MIDKNLLNINLVKGYMITFIYIFEFFECKFIVII